MQKIQMNTVHIEKDGRTIELTTSLIDGYAEFALREDAENLNIETAFKFDGLHFKNIGYSMTAIK